jgi:hypothetical protein
MDVFKEEEEEVLSSSSSSSFWDRIEVTVSISSTAFVMDVIWVLKIVNISSSIC